MVTFTKDGREVSREEFFRGTKTGAAALSEEGKRRVSRTDKPKPLTAFSRTQVSIIGETPPERVKELEKIRRENLQRDFARANLRGDIIKNRLGVFEARTPKGSRVLNLIVSFNKGVSKSEMIVTQPKPLAREVVARTDKRITSQINVDTLRFRGKIRNRIKSLSEKVKQRLKETILNPEAVADTNKTIVKLLRLDKAEQLFLKRALKREGKTSIIDLTFGKKVGSFVDDVSKQLVKETLTKPIQNVALLLGGAVIGKVVGASGKIVKFVAKSNPKLATTLRLGGKVSGVVILGAYASGVVKEAQQELKDTGKVTNTTAKAIREIALIGLGAKFGAKVPKGKFKVNKKVKAINKKVKLSLDKLDKTITKYADKPSSQRKIMGIRGRIGGLRGAKARKSPVRSARKIRISKGELRKRNLARQTQSFTRQELKETKFLFTKKSRAMRLKEVAQQIRKDKAIPKIKFIPTPEKLILPKRRGIPKGLNRFFIDAKTKVISVKKGLGFTKTGKGKIKPGVKEVTTSDGQILILKHKTPLIRKKKFPKLATEKELFKQFKAQARRKGQELLPSRFKPPKGKELLPSRFKEPGKKTPIQTIDVTQEPTPTQIPGVRGIKTGGRERIRQEILTRLRSKVLVKERALKLVKNRSIKAKLKREVAKLKLEAKRLTDIRTQARRQALILPGQRQTLKAVAKLESVAKAQAKKEAIAEAKAITVLDLKEITKLDIKFKPPKKPKEKLKRPKERKGFPIKPQPKVLKQPITKFKPKPFKKPLRKVKEKVTKPKGTILFKKQKPITKFKFKSFKPGQIQALRFTPTIVRPKKKDERLRLYTGAELR